MFAFTFCEAYMVAFCCAAVGDGLIVLTAAFMTAGIVVALTIYALTTKSDFSICGGMLFIIGATMIMIALFSILFGSYNTANIIFCGLAVILFGLYLVIDT